MRHKSNSIDGIVRLVVLVGGLGLAGVARGADPPQLPSQRPEAVGMVGARLDEGVELFRAAVARDEIRGAVLLVARHGQIVLHEAVGWRDADSQAPMELGTRFHVASNTKPVVAAAALQLAAEGKLDLDAPVGRYLPAFDIASYRDVTVRRLLSHTSGLRIPTVFLEPLEAKSATRPDGPTLRSEVDRFATIAPQFRPGTTYSYNNPGFNIVGAVIEAVTGRSIDRVLAERFYEPLSMRDTTHEGLPGSSERRAHVCTRKDEKWTVTYKPGDPPKYPFVRASGGMVTTARDYAQFLQLMLDGGRRESTQLLAPQFVAAATAPQTRQLLKSPNAVAPASPNDGAATNATSTLGVTPSGPFYGYGWQVFADGTYGHGGSDGTYAWVDPRRDLLAIVFTQSPGGKIPRDAFRKLVEQACGDELPPVANRVVAHRGLLREFPENTLVNFRACLERRLGFELDVRRSQDGQLVCLHDATLERTTDGKGPVTERTGEELQKLDAGSWFQAKFQGERLPSLDAVFALAAQLNLGDARIAVDLKGDDTRLEVDVVTLAKKHGVLAKTVMIGRAIEHADVRRRLREADLNTPVACLAPTPADLPRALADTDSDWVYVRFVPDAEEIAKVHAAGKRVFLAGPTVVAKQPENWRRAASRGVDAILTDDAPVLDAQLRDDQRRRDVLRASLAPYFTPPAEFREDFGPYRSPLKLADGGDVTTVADWSRRRAEIEREWRGMLGDWPELIKTPRVKYVATERRENFTQHRVHVEVIPGDKYAEGHLLVPDGPGPFPAALVTFYESATSVGLGERGRGTHDYGLQLVRRGFVTLSIGTPGSLDAPAPQTRTLLTDAGEAFERQPLSILAYVAANAHTALAQLPSVDAQRIGVIGLSYGGKWSMFASCLHQPFACAVWSDPGIVFDEKNGNVNYWEPWYLGYEKGTRRPAGIPNAERPRTGLYKRLFEAGRDLHELHTLVAPRPVLVSGGTEDPPRNWRALNHLVELNRRLGQENRVALTKRQTHVPTAEALELELRFLEYFLKYQ